MEEKREMEERTGVIILGIPTQTFVSILQITTTYSNYITRYILHI